VNDTAPELCPDCGRPRADGDAICGACGRPFPEDAEAGPSAAPAPAGWAAYSAPKDSTKGLVRAVIVVLLILIAILVVGVAQQMS
jgi:predicted amidophosphoribosyltransferase